MKETNYMSRDMTKPTKWLCAKRRLRVLIRFFSARLKKAWVLHLSPLTLEVVGAPQMTLQQYLSILPYLPLPSGNHQTPFPSIHWWSSHLFFCLPLLLAPFTVSCRIVFAMPKDLEMWLYHLSFRFFTMVRSSSCTPIAFWILLRTSSFVPRSL